MSPDPGALTPALADGATVKIVGLGGVGSIVARYGALFLASLAGSHRLVLIDGDEFELKNTSRMHFARPGNKAEVVRDELLEAITDTNLTLAAVPEYVHGESIGRLVQEKDIVLLAVDNHATRRCVSDFCATLADTCLISGGNDGVGEDAGGRSLRGTFGNVQIQLRRAGEELSAPLTRFHPEIADPADRMPTDLSCTELAQSVPQILFTNLAAASAILNAFWLHVCGGLHYDELCFDVAKGVMRPSLPRADAGGRPVAALAR